MGGRTFLALLTASAIVALAPAAVAQPADIDAIRAELADNGVAVLGSAAERQAIADVVTDARGHGLNLSVVVLGEDLPGGLPATESLARDLRQGATTVLVLTPGWLGADSGEISQRALERALDAAETAGVDDAAAVRQFTDAALGRGGVPWAALIVTGIVVALVAVGAGRAWEVRRRRRADATALAEITQQLSGQLAGVADRVVALEPQIALASEVAQSRYALASAAYREVRQELDRPVASRADGDRIETRLIEIRAALDEAAAALDDARRSWG